MGRAISEDLKRRIVLMYETDGLTMEVISERLHVSVGLISKVVHLHRLYGQVTDPFSHRTGCPSVLENDDLQFISTILDANPGLYLDEIQDKLANVRNIHVSIASIARALHRLDLTRKVDSGKENKDSQISMRPAW